MKLTLGEPLHAVWNKLKGNSSRQSVGTINYERTVTSISCPCLCMVMEASEFAEMLWLVTSYNSFQSKHHSPVDYLPTVNPDVVSMYLIHWKVMLY